MNIFNHIKAINKTTLKGGKDKLLNGIKLLISLIILAGFIKVGVNFKLNQNIKSLVINIEGEESQNDLLKSDVLLQIEASFGFDLTGSKIELLDLENIEEVVRQYDFVKSVDLFLDAENNIHINIMPRKPLVRIFDQEGAHYYLDQSGFKIEADGDIRSRVPVVNGIVGPYERDEDGVLLGGLEGVFLLASKIASDPFMTRLIDQIYVKGNYEMVLFPKLGTETIQFGRAEDIDIKFKRLRNFYEGGIRYEGWNKYKEINLRFKDQVVTKESA